MGKLETSVNAALIASKSFLSTADRAKVEAFLQHEPAFLTTAKQEKNDIADILKVMMETFKDNVAEAKNAEEAAVKAHEKFLKTEESDFKTMEEMKEKKQNEIGSNEEELGASKDQLVRAIDEK